MQEKVHLVYTSDANYMMPSCVSAASALAHSTDDHPVVVHLIEEGVSDEQFDEFVRKLRRIRADAEIQRHTWTGDQFKNCRLWRGGTIIYARLVFADVLPEDVDWAFQVDGDTLWLGDPWECLRCRDESKIFMGSFDPPPEHGTFEDIKWMRENVLELNENDYMCAGFALHNVKMMRETGFAQKALDFIHKYPNPPYADQGIMCYLAKGKSAVLPRQWGCFSIYQKGFDFTKPMLVHYVQDNPWVRKNPARLMSDVVLVWFDFVKTVMGEDLLSKYYSRCTRFFRRLAYVFFKHNQWLVNSNHYLATKLRDTVGLSRQTIMALHERFVKFAKEIGK